MTSLAQEADPAHRAPNRTVLALAGVGAATVTLTAFGIAGPEYAATGLLLSPFASATAIHLVGQAQGGEDSYGRTLGNVAIGTLPVIGLLAVTTLAFMGSAWDPDASDSSGTLEALGFVAGASLLVLPSAYAAMRYRAPGVALARTPEGGLVPVARVAVTF